MPTDIIMPQMGESIVEGTITKWLKKPGDKVQRDEPLFEISTDKVDAEIPAPASGVLQEIKVTEGTTVNVNTIVGTIAVDGEVATAMKPASAPAAEKAVAPKAEEKKSAPTAPSAAVPAPAAQEEDEEARSSPLVRKIAREHGVSLSQIPGTGLGGRITKQDIMSFIEGQSAKPASESASTANVGTDAFVRPAKRSEARSLKHSVIPTEAGAPATAQWRACPERSRRGPAFPPRPACQPENKV
jgi:2-oxoglutarate dehydrogenase E2 component (dihydrolipoamide succinyltransferase)